MKTLIFILAAIAVAQCRPLPAQSVQQGTILQVRTERVALRGFGRVEVQFCEAKVGEHVQLLLLDAECPIEPGDCFFLVEAHDVPRYITFRGRRWFDYMQKFLNR